MHDPGTRLGILCTMLRFPMDPTTLPFIFRVSGFQTPSIAPCEEQANGYYFDTATTHRMVAHLFYRCKSYDLSLCL